jgi:hypothetical protein
MHAVDLTGVDWPATQATQLASNSWPVPEEAVLIGQSVQSLTAS